MRSRRVGERVERYSDQAVELTQEALGNVASQTRAVGERATKLVGVELPMKAQKAAPGGGEPRRPQATKKRLRRRLRPRELPGSKRRNGAA